MPQSRERAFYLLAVLGASIQKRGKRMKETVESFFCRQSSVEYIIKKIRSMSDILHLLAHVCRLKQVVAYTRRMCCVSSRNVNQRGLGSASTPTYYSALL